MTDDIDLGHGMSLRPLADPLMGRIHRATTEVLELVTRKAKRLPEAGQETIFALNVLTSALATVTDQIRKTDPDLHKRCVILAVNRLALDMAELETLIKFKGAKN